MGDKYIIELEETPFVQHFKNGAWETIYRVKGFNSLVFDWNGLQMLTPYTEPDLEQVRKEEYEKGFDAGRMLNTGKYEKGVNDAWEAARTLWNTAKRKEIFGYTVFSTALMTLTAQETIEKIRQYEQGKEEQIQVGDEVDAPFGKAIVVNIDSVAKKIWVMYADGRSGFDFFKNAPTKTGRHFPEIAEVLQKMKEASDG